MKIKNVLLKIKSLAILAYCSFDTVIMYRTNVLIELAAHIQGLSIDISWADATPFFFGGTRIVVVCLPTFYVKELPISWSAWLAA